MRPVNTSVPSLPVTCEKGFACSRVMNNLAAHLPRSKLSCPTRAIAITPDGKTAYVINDTYAGTRAPIGPAVSVALENRPVPGQ
jgi:hypothetical protein